MPYTAESVLTLDLLEADTFGAGGVITTQRVATIKVTGADRNHAQVQKLSANLCATSIAIAPLGGSDSSVASTALLLLLTDNPVDVRFNNASNAAISAVKQLFLTGVISSLFLSTGSNATTVRTDIVGGSSISITASKPLP